MKNRNTFTAVVVIALLVVAVGALHARSAKSLRVSVIAASGDYRVKVQNPSILPVYVRYCVKDVAARQGDLPGDERVQYAVQKRVSDSSWKTVDSDLSCDSSGIARE